MRNHERACTRTERTNETNQPTFWNNTNKRCYITQTISVTISPQVSEAQEEDSRKDEVEGGRKAMLAAQLRKQRQGQQQQQQRRPPVSSSSLAVGRSSSSSSLRLQQQSSSTSTTSRPPSLPTTPGSIIASSTTHVPVVTTTTTVVDETTTKDNADTETTTYDFIQLRHSIEQDYTKRLRKITSRNIQMATSTGGGNRNIFGNMFGSGSRGLSSSTTSSDDDVSSCYYEEVQLLQLMKRVDLLGCNVQNDICQNDKKRMLDYNRKILNNNMLQENNNSNSNRGVSTLRPLEDHQTTIIDDEQQQQMRESDKEEEDGNDEKVQGDEDEEAANDDDYGDLLLYDDATFDRFHNYLLEIEECIKLYQQYNDKNDKNESIIDRLLQFNKNNVHYYHVTKQRCWDTRDSIRSELIMMYCHVGLLDRAATMSKQRFADSLRMRYEFNNNNATNKPTTAGNVDKADQEDQEQEQEQYLVRMSHAHVCIHELAICVGNLGNEYYWDALKLLKKAVTMVETELEIDGSRSTAYDSIQQTVIQMTKSIAGPSFDPITTTIDDTTTATATTKLWKKCWNCSKTRSTTTSQLFRCTHCHDVLQLATPAYYCSKECQRSDWPVRLQ